MIPTDTLAGEHLVRASPVAVSTHEEEVVVGEEEGPSEVVLTNEPMEQPSKKLMKQEIIGEEWVVEENLTVGITEAVPRDLPTVAEIEEVLVK